MCGCATFCLSIYLVTAIWVVSEHLCISFCVDVFSLLLGYLPRSGIAGSHCNSNFLKNQVVLPSGCIIFHFPPAVYKGSNFSAFS